MVWMSQGQTHIRLLPKYFYVEEIKTGRKKEMGKTSRRSNLSAEMRAGRAKPEPRVAMAGGVHADDGQAPWASTSVLICHVPLHPFFLCFSESQ